MEILTESLSSDEQPIVLYDKQTNEQGISLYNETLTDVLSTNESVGKEDLTFGIEIEETQYSELAPHPLILADREKAMQALEALLLDIQALKQELQAPLFNGPVCPYERTLLEYLGPDYIVPSINDLALPENFSAENSIRSLVKINKKYSDHMLTHLQVMSAEAADTSFPGITSQNLGNAFAVLSSTTNGQEYIIDKQKAAQHLEFAEMVRKMPTSFILENPLAVAQKLVARYVEIHQPEPLIKQADSLKIEQPLQ